MPRNTSFLASLTNALHGIAIVFSSERNFRIHCLAAVVVVAAAVWLQVSREEAILLTFATVIVLGAELINTTLERIVNLVSPQWQEDARLAKDAAAGMVLVISAGAAVCGVLVFGPRIW